MKIFMLKQISSLEKVYLDSQDIFTEIKSGEALKGERFSYQIMFKSDERFFANIDIEYDFDADVTVRYVGNVPSELPCYPNADDGYERTEPGLFPDVLYPIEDKKILVKPNNCYSLWVTVQVKKTCGQGTYPIKITLSNSEKVLCESKVLNLRVLDKILPEQKMIYTQWFHSDCIAQYYNVEVFSQRYWELVEDFIRAAVRNGINMLLTPVFTPPLDTAVLGERLSVQLVDVSLNDGKYTFNYDKLRKWIRIARRAGIQYFEISHFFTQWGASYAPKVIADVDGVKKKIFGWETSATSDDYILFIRQFITELKPVLLQEGIDDRTFFHISDEPNSEQIESYANAKNIVEDLLDGYIIIDAMSDYEFYEKGIISNPIPCTNNIEEFIEKGMEKRWTYYCCGQGEKLSNRFFGMPLARTRIIGIQFFKYKIEGFLQWGFNFYNSAHSLRQINPYVTTDADSAFPSGDSFVVYPYKTGAIDSIRGEVFFQGLQDARVLELAADKIGHDKVVELIEEKFGKITFTEYPKGFQKMLDLRAYINSLL